MANKKSRSDELFETLRARGLRKRVARAVSDGGAGGEKAARRVLDDLQAAADDLRGRLSGGTPAKSRSAAAQKAARTRKRQAAARSASAKKAAATRSKTSKKS